MLDLGNGFGLSSGMGNAVADLRALLGIQSPANLSIAPSWSSGIPELDSALGGGIPRGRITELVGKHSSGRTTLLRSVVSSALSAGEWVAVIDVSRTLSPAEWSGIGSRLIMIRPKNGDHIAWCADRLLRSSIFALVVLDGVDKLPRSVSIRLAQVARDRDTTIVVLGSGGLPVIASGVHIRLRMSFAKTNNHMCMISVEKGGVPKQYSVSYFINPIRRLGSDAIVGDRRGVSSGTKEKDGK